MIIFEEVNKCSEVRRKLEILEKILSLMDKSLKFEKLTHKYFSNELNYILLIFYECNGKGGDEDRQSTPFTNLDKYKDQSKLAQALHGYIAIFFSISTNRDDERHLMQTSKHDIVKFYRSTSTKSINLRQYELTNLPPISTSIVISYAS